MKRKCFLVLIGFLIIAALFGTTVMLLWNFLVPDIFGLSAISFWQALGILILTRILFGSFVSGKMMMGGMLHGYKNPIHEKWMKMTPEQRKEFIGKRRKFGMGAFGMDHFDVEDRERQENRDE
jgi:ABC-type multidrug transport system fused ATPase/permease subunit